MADTAISMQKLKMFWDSQVHDEEKWSLNKLRLFPAIRSTTEAFFVYPFVILVPLNVEFWKLLRAAGLFAGSILLMRNFGDLMAI